MAERAVGGRAIDANTGRYTKRMRGLVIIVSMLLVPAALASAGDSRRAEFRQALQEIEHGSRSLARHRSLADHPLAAYLELADLRRRIGQLESADFEAFARRHGGQPVVELLRESWLPELARRQDWDGLRATWNGQADDALRCQHAQALLVGGDESPALDVARALWLRGDSAPAGCDPLFAELERRQLLGSGLRWQRIALAAEAGNSALMRYLARGFEALERGRAERYAGFVEQPTAAAAQWPRHSDDGRFLALGLVRLARRDADQAEQLLERLRPRFDAPAEQPWRGRVRAAVALWSAASYRPEAARRLAAVPADAFDAQLHEWRVREALAREDLLAAAQAIAAMPEPQRNEPRWRYLGGRLAQRLGHPERARPVFAALAQEAHYHGFLAADQLAADYPLCPAEVNPDPAMRRQLRGHPGLLRALELHAIGRIGWALREWNQLLSGLDAEQRRLAVELAIEAGWTDRAVFDLNQGDDLRYYRLRFPLAHQRHLSQQAGRHGLDPAWVAALIRAESAWQPQARSHANAYGLMQLLPSTGQDTARQLGLDWQGTRTLFDPQHNISLGTAYLASMLQRKGQQPYLATAAYNAGPTPVARWRQQRPTSEVDLWIETIPYRETRDYVVRVMAFSVIYDWRLGQRAFPLSARLLGQPPSDARRRDFTCPTAIQVAATP